MHVCRLTQLKQGHKLLWRRMLKCSVLLAASSPTCNFFPRRAVVVSLLRLPMQACAATCIAHHAVVEFAGLLDAEVRHMKCGRLQLYAAVYAGQ